MSLLRRVEKITDLYLNKLSPALNCNLDESVTCHVLNSLMGLMHELEKFIDNRFQESPVSPTKNIKIETNLEHHTKPAKKRDY